MSLRIVITGATGMIGRSALLECLEAPEVESILVIGRSPCGTSHPKIREIIHADLFNLDAVKERLAGHDACLYCLGATLAVRSEKEYHRITCDLTVYIAKTLLALNPGITFCYISAAGADTTGRSSVMWTRAKGKAENLLRELPFRRLFLFRPGYIQPMKGVRSRTRAYNIFYFLSSPFYPLLKFFPKFVTTSEKLGQAMIRAAAAGYGKDVLESLDINRLGGGKR